MRRLLLITYHFPPAGGTGTLRALRFARYLGQFGWQPVVLCAAPLPNAPTDESLAAAVPPSVNVRRVISFEPDRYADTWKQPREKIIRNLFRTFDFFLVPDEQVGWVRPGVRAASALFKQHGGFDAILTTGPPFSTHLIGLELRRRFNIPWVADFRDDWTGFNYVFRGGPHRRRASFERRLEEEVLSHASRVLTVNPAIRDAIRARAANAQIDVIPNGFDPMDFDEPISHQADARPFVLRHAGTLYEQRSPAALLEGLRRWSRCEDLRGRLEVRFAGRAVDSAPGLLAAPDLRGIVYYDGVVSHARSIEFMRDSDALLLIIDQVNLADQLWTGKVFEYLASRRPILALMPTQGGLADVLREDSNAHQIVEQDDPDAICEALKRTIDSSKQCQVHTSSVVARFRADHLARNLAELLDDLVRSADSKSMHRPSSAAEADRSTTKCQSSLTAHIVALILMGPRKEPYLPAVLDSLMDAVDLVIVNDNGQQPDSFNRRALERSALYQSGRVALFEAAFQNFSHARNLCLQHLRSMRDASLMTRDLWIMTVDCDEVHGPELPFITRRMLPSLPSTVGVVDGYFVQFMHSFDFFISVDRRHNLLFRHNPQIEWELEVHERLRGLKGTRLCLPYTYYHCGYVATADHILDKWRQYHELGDPSYCASDLAGMTIDSLLRTEVPRSMRYAWRHPPSLAALEAGLEQVGDALAAEFRVMVNSYLSRPLPWAISNVRSYNYRLRLMWRAVQAMLGGLSPELWSGVVKMVL